jgi:hypothetical protein
MRDKDRGFRRDDREDRLGSFFERMGETAGDFFEQMTEGGRGRGRGRSGLVTSLCRGIEREREVLDDLGILSVQDYDGWIDKLERTHSLLSRHVRNMDLVYGVESFIDELKGEKAELEK